MEILIIAAFYLNPILAIVFCLNLVAIIKKMSADSKSDTSKNTFWLTISFMYIVWSITAAALFAY
ncbi:hypothetical protein [Sporosarcina sp. FSL K6-3457]|uniref:hypothetical protein n=1 Tax=Sporosarcina sp. FSL K6-3457 TaxID=2978204 RepID=UPI0030FA5045